MTLLMRLKRKLLSGVDLSAFLVWDDFNRPDALVLGTAPKGGPWQYSVNGADTAVAKLKIVSGQAVALSNELRPMCWLDVGTGELTIQVDMIAFNGPLFRMTDNANYWELQANGATLRLISVNAGTATINASVASTSGFHVLAVDARGTTIKAYRDGVLITTFTSSYLQTATRIGLIGSSGNGDKFDNFWVKP